MAHSFKLVALLLAALSGSAHAAYSNLSPPPGWSAGGSAAWSPPSNGFAAQTANQWIANAAKSSAMLNVGGRQLAVNARLPLAANASRVAAAALFVSPHLRAAVGIASWLGIAKIVWDASESAWKEFKELDDGLVKEYQALNTTQWFANRNAACLHYINARTAGPDERSFLGLLPNGNCKIGYTRAPDAGYEEVQINTRDVVDKCPDGWTPTPGGCLSPQIEKPEFVEKLNPPGVPNPMPSTVPSEFPPGTPFPVKVPIINPSDEPNPRPSPFIVPTGDPVPNPQYDPNVAPGPNNQPWIQPGIKVTPSPTTQEPWRVDIQPVNRPVPRPDAPPALEPLPLPPPKPDADPDNPLPDKDPAPDPDSPDKPKPEEQQSLCEKHPDILACEKLKLGDVEPKDVPDEKKELAINKDPGWGQENGTCPAPRTVQIQGFSLEMPFTLLCDFASGIRPVVIGLAWLAAAFTFMGIGRRS